MPSFPDTILQGLLSRCERSLRDAPEIDRRNPTVITPLSGLRLLAHPARTELEATFYEPVLCVVLRGRKKTIFGEHTFDVRAGDCVLVSHDLPVVSRIVEVPYLALLFDVNLDTLRSLYEELGAPKLDEDVARAFEVHAAPPLLLDALGRFMRLAETPADAKILGPMLAREIHYRLLTASFGGRLRSLARHDSHASAVASAIAHIRLHFREPLAVAELARQVGMSVSLFHRQFKAVTASSPLQYQKELRLLEAHRMLKTGKVSVSATAYDVGYESPNQFSREYARKFGRPPRSDLAKGEARNDALPAVTTPPWTP